MNSNVHCDHGHVLHTLIADKIDKSIKLKECVGKFLYAAACSSQQEFSEVPCWIPIGEVQMIPGRIPGSVENLEVENVRI